MMLRRTIGAVGCAALLLASGAALAQNGGAGQAGQGGGFGRGGQRGGGRGFGRGMQMSVARVPVDVLSSYLHLSSAQSASISKIQENERAQFRAMPRPQPGQPPDPSMFEKFGQISEQTKAAVEGQLTSKQKALVPGMLKELGAAQAARIPMEVVPKLHLTSTQISQLEAMRSQGRGNGGGQNFQQMSPDQRRAMFQQRQQQALAVLTPQQKSIVDAYEAAHPRQRGGPGGGGFGRRGGGGGGAGAPGGGA